jgi:AcrR family transcriptional regulator
VAARKPAPAKPATRQRRARGSLSREEILVAARRFIERDGLHELSFPRLAKELKAAPTSLYWYFHSKDELLAALVDDVTKELYLRLDPIGDGPWDKEIIEYHLRFRALLSSSPVYRDVFGFRAQALFGRSRMTPFILRSIEDDLALFVRAGLSPDDAAKVFNLFSVYTRAFVLVEHNTAAEEIDQEAIELITFTFAKVKADLPAASRLDNVLQIMILDDERFRMGLRFLVAGLCQRYPALRRSAGRAAGGATRRSGRAGAPVRVKAVAQ